MRSRWCSFRRRVLLPALLLVTPLAGARAQGAPPPEARGGARGAVRLELRPRTGDVFRMRLDQQMEVSGSVYRVGASDTTMTVRTDLQVLTRSIIERADDAGTTVLAITDSAVIFSTGASGDWIEQTARRMREQRVRMRLTPDGGMTLVDDAGDPGADARALLAQMPAMLPTGPVAVGATWQRTMGIPLAGGPSEARIGGELEASFRFDSLTRGGQVAWISMRGVLRQRPDAQDAHGVHSDLSGTMSGQIVVDRTRGWITDARTTMQMRSSLQPTAGAPMKFRMVVRQRLRAR